MGSRDISFLFMDRTVYILPSLDGRLLMVAFSRSRQHKMIRMAGVRLRRNALWTDLSRGGYCYSLGQIRPCIWVEYISYCKLSWALSNSHLADGICAIHTVIRFGRTKTLTDSYVQSIFEILVRLAWFRPFSAASNVCYLFRTITN